MYLVYKAINITHCPEATIYVHYDAFYTDRSENYESLDDVCQKNKKIKLKKKGKRTHTKLYGEVKIFLELNSL